MTAIWKWVARRWLEEGERLLHKNNIISELNRYLNYWRDSRWFWITYSNFVKKIKELKEKVEQSSGEGTITSMYLRHSNPDLGRENFVSFFILLLTDTGSYSSSVSDSNYNHNQEQSYRYNRYSLDFHYCDNYFDFQKETKSYTFNDRL